MVVTKRARAGRVRPPEIIFVSTFAVVALFALYSFGRSYAQGAGNDPAVLFRRESEPQDLEVGAI